MTSFDMKVLFTGTDFICIVKHTEFLTYSNLSIKKYLHYSVPYFKIQTCHILIHYSETTPAKNAVLSDNEDDPNQTFAVVHTELASQIHSSTHS